MNRMMRIAYALLLSLPLAAAAYALPQQEEPKSHEGAPAQQAPEAKPADTEKQEPEKQENAQPEKTDKDKEANRDKQEDQNKQDQNKEKEANPASKSSAGEAGSAREMNAQSGDVHSAGKSARIPDDKFRSSFGRQHHFSIGKPTMVNNRPGFHYGGYSFEIVDAWPAGWAYSDDCYVDYIDGEYFLFDLLHPGMRVAVFVEM